MPTYDFLNIETNEVEEHFMSISAKEKYLKDMKSMKSMKNIKEIIHT